MQKKTEALRKERDRVGGTLPCFIDKNSCEPGIIIIALRPFLLGGKRWNKMRVKRRALLLLCVWMALVAAMGSFAAQAQAVSGGVTFKDTVDEGIQPNAVEVPYFNVPRPGGGGRMTHLFPGILCGLDSSAGRWSFCWTMDLSPFRLIS